MMEQKDNSEKDQRSSTTLSGIFPTAEEVIPDEEMNDIVEDQDEEVCNVVNFNVWWICFE